MSDKEAEKPKKRRRGTYVNVYAGAIAMGNSNKLQPGEEVKLYADEAKQFGKFLRKK